MMRLPQKQDHLIPLGLKSDLEQRQIWNFTAAHLRHLSLSLLSDLDSPLTLQLHGSSTNEPIGQNLRTSQKKMSGT